MNLIKGKTAILVMNNAGFARGAGEIFHRHIDKIVKLTGPETVVFVGGTDLDGCFMAKDFVEADYLTLQSALETWGCGGSNLVKVLQQMSDKPEAQYCENLLMFGNFLNWDSYAYDKPKIEWVRKRKLLAVTSTEWLPHTREALGQIQGPIKIPVITDEQLTFKILFDELESPD